MIRALLATAAVAFAGNVSFGPPASMWAGWIFWTALGLVVTLAILSVLNWLAVRRDARVRAHRSLRWR